MKKLNIVLLVIFMFSFVQLNAQNYDSQSKFSIFTYGGIGFAKIENDNESSYNLNVSSAELLIFYRIGKAYGVATGVGFDSFSGNAFNSTGNFYHERNSLRIPLLLMYNYNISKSVKIFGNIGFYGRNISSDEYQAANVMTIVDTYEGWNFGMQTSIGLGYNFSERSSMGLSINNQGDFTNIESVSTNVNTGSKNQQKTKGMYTIGLSFSFGF